MRTLVVIFVAIIAMVIPNFGLFISLSGAFTCTALAFILPVFPCFNPLVYLVFEGIWKLSDNKREGLNIFNYGVWNFLWYSEFRYEHWRYH